MIVGLGSDIVDIRRIESTLARFGSRFVERVFTAGEQARCDRRAARAAGYAKRFAAKEACAKALGTGLFRDGVHFRDIGVTNLPSGKPVLELTEGAARRLESLIPAGLVPQIDVSLSDDYPLAQAVVIISATARPVT